MFVFRHTSNLASEDVDDLQRQGIAVNDDSDPAPENIPVSEKIPDHNWNMRTVRDHNESFSQGDQKYIHNTNVSFKNYSREEVMEMMKLGLFLILSPVEYLKEILIPKTNKLLKHPIDLGEFFLVAGMLVLHGFLGRNFKQEELVTNRGTNNVCRRTFYT